MARVKGNSLGQLYGKLGQIVARVRYGEVIFSARPKSFNKSMLPSEVDKRGKFGINSKFAKVLNQDYYLYLAWKKSKLKARHPFFKMTEVNFQYCRPDRPSVDNVITPPNGFKFPSTKIEAKPDGAEIKLKRVALKKNEKNIFYIMYINFFQPVKKQSSFNETIKIKEYSIKGSLLEFRFAVDEKTTAALYKKRTIYVCAVTVDRNNKVVRYSKTLAVGN